MSEFYDDLAQTAAEMLAEFGRPVVLTHSGAPTYDPATGTTTAGSTDTTVSGAKFEYNTFIRSGVRNEPGSLIQAGDKQLLLAPTDVDGAAFDAPVSGDTVLLGTVSYTITAVAPTDPAGQIVYYECNIRGAA